MTEEKEQFEGFDPEPKTNFWPYPKALNGWWHQLSGSEQKVLDYILRHTWGYRKTADKISLSQFKRGIKNRENSWIDKGTGLIKNHTIIKALNKLEKLGFVEVIKKTGKTSEYKLRLVPKKDYTSPQREEVASPQKGHTITDITILSSKEDSEPSSPPISEKNEILSSQTEKKLNQLWEVMRWAEEERGAPFVNRPKQLKYIKILKEAKISISSIKKRWQEMAEDKFWGEKGYDFKNLCDDFDRKK